MHAELRDPTRPMILPGEQVTATGKPELSAIIISKDRRIAVISGSVVRVGDIIGNAKVVSIESNTVQLDAPSGRITLNLMDSTVRQAVGDDE